jgi:hypothetical protein
VLISFIQQVSGPLLAEPRPTLPSASSPTPRAAANEQQWAGFRPVDVPPLLVSWSPCLLCALGARVRGPLAEALDGEQGGQTVEVLWQYKATTSSRQSICLLVAACVE